MISELWRCGLLQSAAETGLTLNSWYGKFHLEMHWWHGVHFALWGHPEVLESSLPWYRSILPMAKQTAEEQATPTEGDEVEKAKKKEKEPRVNGVIECNYDS